MTTDLDNAVNTAEAAALKLLAGQARLDEGRHEEALSLFAQAVTALSTSDADELIVHALTEQGGALRIAGRYEEAARTLHVVLDHATVQKAWARTARVT